MQKCLTSLGAEGRDSEQKKRLDPRVKGMEMDSLLFPKPSAWACLKRKQHWPVVNVIFMAELTPVLPFSWCPFHN